MPSESAISLAEPKVTPEAQKTLTDVSGQSVLAENPIKHALGHTEKKLIAEKPKLDLPPEIMSRLEQAETAGFTPETPYTSNPSKVIMEAAENLKDPSEIYNMAGFNWRGIRRGRNGADPDDSSSRTNSGSLPDQASAVGSGRPPESPPPLDRRPSRNREPEDERNERLELPRKIEEMTSPELEEVGISLVENILEMRINMTYDERYEGENGVRLKRMYDTIQAIVDELCKNRDYSEDSWGPHRAFPKPTTVIDEEGNRVFEAPKFGPEPEERAAMRATAEKFKEEYGRQSRATTQERAHERFPDVDPLPDPEDETRSIQQRFAQYQSPRSREMYAEAQADLQLYFKQAKNHGLLDEVDGVLDQLSQQLANASLSPEQKRALLEQGIDRARVTGVAAVRELIVAQDSDVPFELAEVWNPYTEWARRRMEMSINNRPAAEHREGEWRYAPIAEASKGKETYWGLGPYPKMYVIEARTEEQFTTAKDTFLKMVSDGLIGRAPTSNFEHIKNFIDEFSRTGGIQVIDGNISGRFLEENRKEMEGLLYLLVSNYAKEVYNPKQSKEAAEAMSADEPTRWVSAYLAGNGDVAGFTQDFDYDARMEMFNNPFGERGELDTIAGHFFQDAIQRIMVERGMGRVLKDYDPRDENLSLKSLSAKIQAAEDLIRIKKRLEEIQADLKSGKLELPDDFKQRKLSEGVIIIEEGGKIVLQKEAAFTDLLTDREGLRLKTLETNRKKLALTRSEEEFKGFFECFDSGDYHKNNFREYWEDQKLPEGERQLPALEKLPESIRKSINLGRIQVTLERIRKEVASGEMRLGQGQNIVQLLDPEDRVIYGEAFGRAKGNFEVAFQMQGVLGEKARRGKGYLLVDRNLHVQSYYEVSDRFRSKWSDLEELPFIADYPGRTEDIIEHNHDTEKNERKKVRAINMDDCSESQIETLAIQLVEAGKLNQSVVDSFKKGWMLRKIRDGKELDSFSRDWKEMYDGMSAKEKEDVVESIPTWEMENWVQWGITQIKHQYRDASAAERLKAVKEGRIRLTKEIKTYGYSAQLIAEDRRSGRPPVLMTYKRPLGSVDSETGKFKKHQQGEVLGYSERGEEVKIDFDDRGILQGIDFDQQGAVIYDSANPDSRQRRKYDGLSRGLKATLVDGVLVEEAVPTFKMASSGADFRCWSTMDTYFYYQGNNKDTILRPHIFAGAERILAGVSRPGDEDPLCLRLLTIDPTLKRVKEFPKEQQGRERKLIAAALAESFNDKMRIRHGIYRAFMPTDGYSSRMRAGFRNEDWAGMDRLTFGFVEAAAEEPLRFARRMKGALALLAFEHDSAPGRWGVHGVSGAINLLADNIKNISHQGVKGMFGLMKVFEEFDLAIEMFNAIKGYTDSQRKEHVFGLGEKPVDDYDALHKYYKDLHDRHLFRQPEKVFPFLQDLLTHFGRLRTFLRKQRAMHTNNENSEEALLLEGKEVFLADGSYNVAIDSEQANGYGRQRQSAFLDGEDEEQGFFSWLADQSPGGGTDMYRSDGPLFWVLNEEYSKYSGIELAPVPAGTVKGYVKDKLI